MFKKLELWQVYNSKKSLLRMGSFYNFPFFFCMFIYKSESNLKNKKDKIFKIK